jgi:hypothetical protein
MAPKETNLLEILEELVKINKDLAKKVEFLTKRLLELEELIYYIQIERYYEKLNKPDEIWIEKN